jgi:hypothetical protein
MARMGISLYVLTMLYIFYQLLTSQASSRYEKLRAKVELNRTPGAVSPLD